MEYIIFNDSKALLVKKRLRWQKFTFGFALAEVFYLKKKIPITNMYPNL